MTETTEEKVVELLNEASVNPKDTFRVTNLKHVQELILNKEPKLLDNFLEEILQFQLDKSSDVKKTVISFIEDACKKDCELITKLVDSLRFLFYDENVNVQKKAYLSMINIFKVVVKWLARSKSNDNLLKQTWESLVDMKNHIIAQLESDNDGIRTATIKFIEMLIILYTVKSKDKIADSGDSSIDQISDENKYLRKSTIIQEGKYLMEKLLEYTLTPHISSVNLISCIAVFGNIAKQKPEYMNKILHMFARLQANLPPTLSKSQASSVKKQIKLQLISIIKQQNLVNYHAQIVPLLSDLDMNQNEINKLIPKSVLIESRKRVALSSSNSTAANNQNDFESTSKKPKPNDNYDDNDNDRDDELNQQTNLIETTLDDLTDKLCIKDNIVDLVLVSMLQLPDLMPQTFATTYKPIAAAGTQIQIRQLAKLLCSQLLMAGCIKGSEKLDRELIETKIEEDEPIVDDTLFDVKKSSPQANYEDIKKKQLQILQPKKPSKTYKLSEVTRQFSRNQIETMLSCTYKRILNTEELIENTSVVQCRKKLLINFTDNIDYEDYLVKYIFSNLRKRTDLGVLWLYNCFIQFNSKPQYRNQYERVLYTLLYNLQRHDPRDLLFTRVFSEVPLVTDNLFELIKTFCEDPTRSYIGMTTIRDSILRRYIIRDTLLSLLLNFTLDDNQEIRNNSIIITKTLHEKNEFRQEIEKYALDQLKNLINMNPSSLAVLKPDKVSTDEWTEDTIRTCLYLYLALMPHNHSLIHPLSQIYSGATSEVKRTILRMLEVPIKEMGMNSPELLKLIEDCPKGSETLITRIIHILTDKNSPSQVLIDKVRDLYVKRVSDVRFLIPVLNFLSKKEVLSALPHLIKLSPTVVKEVFSRLYETTGHPSPISPAELLIALHQIDPSVCDLKMVINATSLCFTDKHVYTQEVLAIVIQQLVEINPIPTLLMRSVIQTLSIYPKLTGFILNVMQRLITKQIWKFPKVWEGFVKCCQRTKPASLQLLLQLPITQLKEVITSNVDLREALQKYLNSLAPNQRAQIPESLIRVIEQYTTNTDESSIMAHSVQRRDSNSSNGSAAVLTENRTRINVQDSEGNMQI